jgi:putative hydrolase of the HAD superfamily
MAAVEPRVRKTLDRPPSPGFATDAERGWHYFNLVLSQAGIVRSAATDAALAEVKAWHDQHCLWEEVLEGVPASLDGFRSAGLRLAAVSNSNGTLRRLFARLGFARVFDVVVDSHVEGVEKPDPRIFHLALERLGTEPAAAIHVGDFYHVDVVGARSAGIRPVLVDEAGLYADADCPRVRSVAELAAHLLKEGGPVSATLPAER